MTDKTAYQLERARTYRAEAQQGIEYILSNADNAKAGLILKSIKRSLEAELGMPHAQNNSYGKIIAGITERLSDETDTFSQLEVIRNDFYKFVTERSESR